MLTSVPSHLKTSGNLLKLKIDLGSGKDTELLAARILTSISAKRQWISELDSLERFPSLSLIPSDCATTKPCAISLVSAGISCLSFLEIQFEPLLESVEQLLRNLLECIHSASVTAMSQEFQGPHVKGRRSYVLVSLIAHTLRSITSRALRCGLTKDLGCLWQIVMYDFLTLCDGNAAALSGVADYCEALSSESRCVFIILRICSHLLIVLHHSSSKFSKQIQGPELYGEHFWTGGIFYWLVRSFYKVSRFANHQLIPATCHGGIWEQGNIVQWAMQAFIALSGNGADDGLIAILP